MIRRHLEQHLGAIHRLRRPREVPGELLRLGEGAERGAAHRHLYDVFVHREDFALPVSDRQRRCSLAQPQPLAWAWRSANDHPREFLGADRVLRKRRPGHAGDIAAFCGINDDFSKDGLAAGASGNHDSCRLACGIPKQLCGIAPEKERHAGFNERLVKGALHLHGGGEFGELLARRRSPERRGAFDHNLTEQKPLRSRTALHLELEVTRPGLDCGGKVEPLLLRRSPAQRFGW